MEVRSGCNNFYATIINLKINSDSHPFKRFYFNCILHFKLEIFCFQILNFSITISVLIYLFDRAI